MAPSVSDLHEPQWPSPEQSRAEIKANKGNEAQMKVEQAEEQTKDQTPLEAISHGPIVMAGRHFGMISAGDLMCLDVRTGEIVGGNKTRPANAAGFLIHSSIHKARPDIHSICHAHTDAGRAWSTFGKPLDICNFYGALAVYDDYGGIVFAEEEGKRIAKALGTSNKAAILRNHGLLTTGSTVDEAGFLFGLLDRGCRIQLSIETAMAGNSSLKKNLIPDEEAAYNFRMASEKNALYAEAQPDLELEIESARGGVERGVEGMSVDERWRI